MPHPRSPQSPVRSRSPRRKPARLASTSSASGAAPATDLRIVLSTAPPRAATSIARALVRSGVAACVNAVPGVRSVYRWQGAVEEGVEVLLVVKTTAAALPDCLRALVGAHPYEVPEGLVVVPEAALPAYARWVRATSGVHPNRRVASVRSVRRGTQR